MSAARRHLWETVAGICILASLIIGTSAWIRVDHVARDASNNSRVVCERTIRYAPSIAHALKQLDFPSELVRDYITTVPKKCD